MTCLSSRKPLISIAPQNATSPSPCEKCISPVLRLAPSTNTGRYTLEPLLRFLMSQFPPFSLPGIVLAASLAIFSHSGLPSLICKLTSYICHNKDRLRNIMQILIYIYIYLCHTSPRTHPFVDGRFANGLECKTSHNLSVSRPFSSSSLSLLFHMLSNSIEGAVPTIPGCVKPGNLTPACVDCLYFDQDRSLAIRSSSISKKNVYIQNYQEYEESRHIFLQNTI